jgi:hypothetical protein
VKNRLTLNLGLRYEYEGGFVERQNRGLGGGFTFGQKLPISAAAEAAYLRSRFPAWLRSRSRAATRTSG